MIGIGPDGHAAIGRGITARDQTARGRVPMPFVIALAAPAVVFIGGFYVWPFVALAAKSMTADAWREALGDPAIRHVLWFTTWQAVVSTALTLVVGLVPAGVLARFEFRGRRLVIAMLTVPFVLPTVVVGAAFLAILPDSLDQGVVPVLVAHVFFNVAVVVRGVGGLWEQLPRDLGHAARTLGASPWQVARHVTLPLLAPSIAASASVVFLFTFTSFGVVRLLGGPARPTLEVEIWQRAVRFGDVGVAAALSFAQLVLLGLIVLWFGHLQARQRRALNIRPLSDRRRARVRGHRLLVAATAAFAAIAVGAPLAALVERSTRTGSRHTLDAWRAVFADGQSAPTWPGPTNTVDAFGSLTVSLRFAVIAMVISLVIGGCAAFAIAVLGRAGRGLDTGLMLPLGTSAVTIGLGLLLAFDTSPIDWRAAPLLIPIGHALVATPFVVRLVLPTLRSIDSRLRDAAATLGASPMRAWREVDLRIALRPLVTAAGFALAISLGEFGATTFLTRQGRATLPIAIEQLLNRPGAALHAQGYVLAVVLALLTLVAVGAVELTRGRGDHARGA